MIDGIHIHIRIDIHILGHVSHGIHDVILILMAEVVEVEAEEVGIEIGEITETEEITEIIETEIEVVIGTEIEAVIGTEIETTETETAAMKGQDMKEPVEEKVVMSVIEN